VQLLKTGYSFQQPAQVKLKRNIYDQVIRTATNLWTYLPSGKRYGRTWLNGVKVKPYGEILFFEHKPLRYLSLKILADKNLSISTLTSARTFRGGCRWKVKNFLL